MLLLGHGVLIDHATWAEEASITPRFLPSNVIGGYIRDCREAPSPLSKGRYPLRPIGATKEWDAMTDAQKRQYSDNPKPEHASVEATTDILQWLWDTGFAAIAGDAMAGRWVMPSRGRLPRRAAIANWLNLRNDEAG